MKPQFMKFRSLAHLCAIAIIATPACLQAASVARWTTYQGTADHYGFVDTATRLPASATPRWSRQLVPATLPAGGTYIGLAIANGKVYVTSPQRFTPINPIVAVNLLDGTPVWDRNYPGVNSVNPPAVSAAGDVYFITGNHAPDTFLRVLDGATGTPIISTPMTAQWQRYLAPTIFDGRVGTPGGTDSGLHSYLFDGSFLHSSPSLERDMWTPTPWRDQWVVYTDRLWLIDRNTGGLIGSISVPGYQTPSIELGQAPVIIEDVAYVTNGDRILAFDLSARQLIFARSAAELGNSFLHGQVATDGQQLFVGGWPNMVVLDRDGALQDTYANTPGDGFGPTSIVTRTHVFGWSSSSKVNVFDRQTGDRVLTFEGPDEIIDVAALAMADQTLVVAYRDGTVSAFTVPFDTVHADGFERID